MQLDIDDRPIGHFSIRHEWRKGLAGLFRSLASGFSLHILSGDNEGDKLRLSQVFPSPQHMHFYQTPQQKLDYIRRLQQQGRKVMMIGDGLNDAGALKQSDLGVAVSDNVNNFNPACDAILEGTSLIRLGQFTAQAKDAVKTIRASFAIALCYNLAGVSVAVQGILTPLTAAVLMPVSTVTIMLFTSLASRYTVRKNKLIPVS